MSRVIRFTGYEIDADQILARTRPVPPPWPATWTRHQFTIRNCFIDPIGEIDSWIEENVATARWGSYAHSSVFSGWTVVLLFESMNDAVVFRLTNGENAWRQDNR